jgi:ribose/xylose/arabinose/galactoside ABC-type transport system permease subunit
MTNLPNGEMRRMNVKQSKKWNTDDLRELGIFIAFIIIVCVLMIFSPPGFRSGRNMLNILKQTSINGILATGMMYVIITGGIDLSVGSIAALSGVMAAHFAHPGEYPLIIPILLPVFIGTLVGLFNGIGVTYGSIPPFIVTLGSMTIFRGAALIASKGQPVFNVSKPFEAISGAFVFDTIPVLVIYYIVITLIFAFVLTRTVFGRHVYMVGGNETAARVSGIDTFKVKIVVYMISGFLAGIAGLLLTSRTISANPTAAQGYEMDAITAVIIGGVSMSGGSGKWYGTVIGALLISIIANSLDILNVSSHYQPVIKGMIIILAVLMDMKTKNRGK